MTDWYVSDVAVTTGELALPGRLTVPADPAGIVVFADVSGRYGSVRSRAVAPVLHAARLGTLVFGLLTPDEAVDRSWVFDVDLLDRRLHTVVDWLRCQPPVGHASIGLHGVGTGTAAALRVAAEPDSDIAAVVSRSGRPELAYDRLSQVRAPTLLIVGGEDDLVVDLNCRARDRLRCPNRVVAINGAHRLFEEPGTLEAAAELARDWFSIHLRQHAQQRLLHPPASR